jgi:hypothetical protein
MGGSGVNLRFWLLFLLVMALEIIPTTGVLATTCFGDKAHTAAALERLSGLVSCATNKSVNNCPDRATNPLVRDVTRGIILDTVGKITNAAWDNTVEGQIAAEARVKSAEARRFIDNKVKTFLIQHPELQKMAEAMSPENIQNQDKLLKQLGVNMKTNSVSGPYIYRSDKYADDTMAAIWKYARGHALDADDIGELMPDLKVAAEHLAKMRAATTPQQLDAAIKAFNTATNSKITPPKAALTGIIQKSGFNASEAVSVSGAKTIAGRVAKKFMPIVAVPVAAYVGCKMSTGSQDCGGESAQSIIDVMSFFTTTGKVGCSERYSEYEEIESECKRRSGWTQGKRKFLSELSDEQQQKELTEFPLFCQNLQNLYRQSFPTISSVSKCSLNSVEFSFKDATSEEPRRILTSFNEKGALTDLKNSSSSTYFVEMSWDSAGALSSLWNVTGRSRSPYFTQNKTRGSPNDLEKTDEIYFNTSSQILLSQELKKCCSRPDASGSGCLAEINNTTRAHSDVHSGSKYQNSFSNSK